MKIRHKIILVSTLIFGVVLLIADLIIYLSFQKSSQNIFFNELARTAQIAGMFYLEEDELTKAQFQPIADAFYNLSPDQKVSIYDEEDSTAFDTEKNKSKTILPLLDEVRKRGHLNFKDGLDYYHGLFYKDNQGDFVVLVKAQNPLIQDQLRNLIYILFITFSVGMLALIALTWWLSKLAYKPVQNIIRQVNRLDLNQKPLSLHYHSTGDELEELFLAFNHLLTEIEETYTQQKNFIDYASHELKTPLANILNHSEANLQKSGPEDGIRESSEIIYSEAERLQKMLKNLLTFSSLNRVAQQRESVRVDELIWDIIQQLSSGYREDKFQVDIGVSPANQELLEIQGNGTLLAMTLFNFIENAAKFSGEKPVLIELKEVDRHLHLSIKDEGIGISTTDLEKIAQPFFRGQNAGSFAGNGLGMSIALKILKLHHIKFDIQSEEERGTEIGLTFSSRFTQNF